MDRIACSVPELMQITQTLQDKKCDLQVFDQELDTSTPNGRLIFHVLVEIGELIPERAVAAGVKFGRKPSLFKRTEREFHEVLGIVVISKDIARQFNVSGATFYKLPVKLDKDFVEQVQFG